MALVGCFVTPHPPIIIPEVGGGRRDDARPTISAMEAVQRRAAELEPDAIVMLSPHAPLAFREMVVSLAPAYHGSFVFFGAPRVRVDVDGDAELGRAIMEEAAREGIPVVANSVGREVLDLDHGALVPLVYLLGSLEKPCRLVLLSFSQLGIDEHIRYGGAVGRALLAAPQRIVYVASGDMSHRLLPDSPNGFDPRGPQFDHAIESTFATGDWDRMVSLPLGMTQAAGECGYRSLAVLRGIVGTVEAAGIRTENHLLSYEGPFGVGYLVGEVEFVQRSETQGAAERG